MITRVEVLSPQLDAPELPLGGPLANDDPIHLLDAKGLEPVKADISTETYANADGAIFKGASVGARNIVLTFGLNPDWEVQTMADLRQLLYKYFMPKSFTKLKFYHSSIPTTQIDGIVESMEPNIFAKDPQIDVSIICPRPHFVETNYTTVNGFVNEGDPTYLIDYDGTAPTGFDLTVSAPEEDGGTDELYTGAISVINEVPTGPGFLRVDPVAIDPLTNFQLVTVQSRRRVYSVNLSTDALTNLLPQMTADSNWPMLQPGKNVISVQAEADIQFPWVMRYYARYGGL